LQGKQYIKYLIEKLSSKQGRLELWRGTKYSVVTVVTMPVRVTGMLRELLREGCFQIEDSFEYKGATFTLKTFIQPDADIITVIGIPFLNEYSPKDLEVDAKGEELLMRNYVAHNLRVVTAFEEFDGRKQFWGTAIDVSLILTNILSIADAIIAPENFDGKADLGFYVIDVPQLLTQINPELGILISEPGVIAAISATFLAAVSIAMRKFLRREAVSIIVSVLFKVVRWFMEWRAKKK
jgi:hypothetical protein